MTIDSIKARIEAYRVRNLSLFASSSFQTQSVPLLHILSRVDPSIPVYFIDTGYLFPETYLFRDELAARFGLNVVTLRPAVTKLEQLAADGSLMFARNPDLCCHLNKVQPMETALARHDVWINGVRADQTAERRAMSEEEPGPFGVLRYHPLLDWTGADVARYLREHDLPSHPLEDQGYASIGCEPCTRRILAGGGLRDGRWAGMRKRECGLHTTLARGERPDDDQRAG